MALNVVEYYRSRARTTDRGEGEADFHYHVFWSADSEAVREAVAAAAAETYMSLIRGPMRLEHLGGGIWEVKVKYNKNEKVDMLFDFMCEKGKVQQSKQTIDNVRVRDIANLGPFGPEFNRLVNVSKDKVEGVDIYLPKSFKLEIKYTFRWTSLPAGYIATVRQMAPSVNADDVYFTFKNQTFFFASGTLLFVGATFHSFSDAGCEMHFRFEGRDNESNIKVGERSGFYPNAQTTLDGSVDGSQTSFPVASAYTFVAATPFVITVDSEDMIVTSITGNVFTVTRAANGTSATTHALGAMVRYVGTATTNANYAPLSKEGHQYIWLAIAKVPNGSGGTVEKPDSAHIERMYDYEDFAYLEVFDVVDNQDVIENTTLDADSADEQADEEDLFGDFDGLIGIQ